MPDSPLPAGADTSTPALMDHLTVGGTLVEAARCWPDREALVMGPRRASWADLLEQSITLARGLLGMGVRPGDHVGLLMANCWDYVLLTYASCLIGARPVTLNARYREDDLAYVIPHADIRWLFTGGHALPHTDYHAMLCRVYPALATWSGANPLQIAEAPELRMVFNLDDPRACAWPDGAALHAAARGIAPETVLEAAASVRPDDVCLMMFSSGTTARPKACMLTHASLTRTGQGYAERFVLTAYDKLWDPLPFFHMSTMLPLTACRLTGACFYGVTHFDAGDALVEMAAEKVTICYAAFPTLLSAITTHADFSKHDLSSVRALQMVGPPDLMRRYIQFFPGARPYTAYGLTEASGVSVYTDPADSFEDAIELNGTPLAGSAFRITDPETGLEVADGQQGEIWLRGFAIFKGYYKDRDATSRVVTPDGWLRTGDLGRRAPANHIIYDGRLKDMLKIGGENVAAVEVESFLSRHPAVELVQLISVPDDHLLEVGAAYVQLKPGASASEGDLIDFCIGRIASYKIPRYIRFVDEWPLSATKIQKFKLRATFEPHGKIDVRAHLDARRAQEASG